MTTEDRLSELSESVDKLKALLDDPQLGLSTWWAFLDERIKDIARIWGLIL